MLLRAKHFARIGRTMKRPGDVFEADLPADTLARLEQLGAVERVHDGGALAGHPDFTASPEPDDVKPTDDEAEMAAPEIDVMDGIGMGKAETDTPKLPKLNRRRSK